MTGAITTSPKRTSPLLSGEGLDPVKFPVTFESLFRHPFAQATNDPRVRQIFALSDLLLGNLGHFPNIAEIIRAKAPMPLRDKAHSRSIAKEWKFFKEFVDGDKELSKVPPSEDTLWTFRKIVYALPLLKNITVWKAWFDRWCLYPHAIQRPPDAVLPFREWLNTQPEAARRKIDMAARRAGYTFATTVKLTPVRMGGIAGIEFTRSAHDATPYRLGFSVSEIPTRDDEGLVSPEASLDPFKTSALGVPARILDYDTRASRTSERQGQFTRLVLGMGPVEVNSIYERIPLDHRGVPQECEVGLIAANKIEDDDVGRGKVSVPKHILTDQVIARGLQLHLPELFFTALRRGEEHLRVYLVPYSAELVRLSMGENAFSYNFVASERNAAYCISTRTYEIQSLRMFTSKINDHTGNRHMRSTEVARFMRFETDKCPKPYPLHGRIVPQLNKKREVIGSPVICFSFLGTSIRCAAPEGLSGEVTIQPIIERPRLKRSTRRVMFEIYPKNKIDGSPYRRIGPYYYEGSKFILEPAARKRPAEASLRQSPLIELRYQPEMPVSARRHP